MIDIDTTRQTEIAYWIDQVQAPGEKALELLTSFQRVFQALEHEKTAGKDLTQVEQAMSRQEWAEAYSAYLRAADNLGYALSDWNMALDEIGHDTPLCAFAPTKEQQKQGRTAPSKSLQETATLIPHMERVHGNISRILSWLDELNDQALYCLVMWREEGGGA